LPRCQERARLRNRPGTPKIDNADLFLPPSFVGKIRRQVSFPRLLDCLYFLMVMPASIYPYPMLILVPSFNSRSSLQVRPTWP
jgi:hypothetical protein